jgi:proton-translocating NADH-quinone oxidoreductase chain N
MTPLLEILNVIWGRVSYLFGVPVQAFGQWAWQHTAYYLLAPEIFLLAAILVICVVEVLSKRDNFILVSWLALIGLSLNFLMTVHMMYFTSRYYSYALGVWWGGLETLDPYAIFFKQVMDWGDILLMLALMVYKPLKQYRVEFIIIMLTGTVAYDLMVGSSDLLAVYVMTEFGGICSYVLASFYKKDLRSLEAGLKYFITGAASSTALLFALSIIYGAVNTTNFYAIQQALLSGGAKMPAVVFAVVLAIVALGYKVGIAPFHLWVADVYEGAPTPVTTFISIFPKVAGYAVLLRLLFIPFGPLKDVWVPVVIVISILSMLIGNVMALRQTSFKRMMGFSGIAHMGYVLIGITAASYTAGDATQTLGFWAAMYYMLTYLFMNLGVFLVAMANENYGGSDHMDSYNGLVQRNAFLAVLMTILLAGLTGLPPTVGFIAKLLIFYAITPFYIFSLWNIALAVFAVLTMVIGSYYYMRLAWRMWALKPLFHLSRKFEPALFMRVAILVPTVLILLLGIVFVSVPFDYVRGAWFMIYYTEGSAI